MKAINLITLFLGSFLFFISSASANDDKYIEVMQKNISALYQAKEIGDYQKAVNALERIASVEKTKWEPLYYVAFGNIMMANFEKEAAKKDLLLDKAMEAIGRGKVLSPQESELVALEGFALMIRLSIDPQTRGMVYAPQATEAFNKAIALEPENPRAMMLLAQMQYGSAQFFGTSVAEACALNSRAGESLKTYKSKNPLAPAWGEGMIESLKENCK